MCICIRNVLSVGLVSMFMSRFHSNLYYRLVIDCNETSCLISVLMTLAFIDVYRVKIIPGKKLELKGIFIILSQSSQLFHISSISLICR